MKMIVKQLIFIISLLVVETYSASTVDIICSSSTIISMNSTNRNVNFKSTAYTCDGAIARGYYTFGPDAKIPNFCPTVDSCQSDAPLWTNDTQPTASSPGPVVLNVCASVSTKGNDQLCKFDCSLNVSAVYCSNINAIVYELYSVNMCNERWCYDKKIACGKNESSLTGYQPCSTPFPFNLLTNTTTTYGIEETDNRFKNIAGISLLCSIKCPSSQDCSKLSGDVLWYIKTSTTPFKQTTLLYDSISKELYSYLQENDWSAFINNYIYCSITPNLNGNRPYQSIITPSFYAGLVLNVTTTVGITNLYRLIETPQVSLILNEGDEKYAQLEIYSTLPILCDSRFLINTATCSLDISLAKETIYDKVRTNCKSDNNANSCNGCSKSITNQTIPNPKNIARYLITATIEEGNSNKQNPETIKINLLTKWTYKLKSTIYKNLLLPTINVDYIPKSQNVVRSYCVNDPHCYSNDGTYIEFHRDGEYLIMENVEASLRISIVARSCQTLYGQWNWNWVYCNYAIYIQSVDDHVYFLHGQGLFYKDLSNPTSPIVKLAFDTKTGYAQMSYKKTAIKISIENNYYKIVTHFSTVILIDGAGNFYIYPSKYDYGRVYGLLGNYNGKSSDDLTTTKCGTVSTLNAYLDCYKITSPLMSKGQYYPIPSSQNITNYCMCINNINATLYCPFGLRQDDGKTVSYGKKSQLLNNDPNFSIEILNDITKKSQILKNQNKEILNKKTKVVRSTNDLCIDTLNKAIFQECNNLKLIDLPTLIYLCQLDFNGTGIDWSKTYYDLALEGCNTKLSNDKLNYQVASNGTLVPKLNLLSQLCPNDCNMNGNCVGGKCFCFPPFDGADCSKNTSAPLRLYNSSSINDICSSNTTSNCLDVLFLVNRITTNLIINYEIMYKSGSSGSFQLLDKQSSNVYMIDDNIIYTQLYNKTKIPNGSLSVYYFNITIKDNATSNSIIYSIINNDCHQCTNSIDCTIKSNKCDIDSICYNANDPNPLDSSKKCDPSKSALSWTSSTSWTSGVSLIKLNSFICLFLILIYSFFNF